MPLKPHERTPYIRHATKLGGGIADGPVFQFEEVRQLGPVEFSDALLDVLREDEFQEGLCLPIILRGYQRPAGVGAFLAGDRGKCEGDVDQSPGRAKRAFRHETKGGGAQRVGLHDLPSAAVRTAGRGVMLRVTVQVPVTPTRARNGWCGEQKIIHSEQISKETSDAARWQASRLG